MSNAQRPCRKFLSASGLYGGETNSCNRGNFVSTKVSMVPLYTHAVRPRRMASSTEDMCRVPAFRTVRNAAVLAVYANAQQTKDEQHTVPVRSYLPKSVVG